MAAETFHQFVQAINAHSIDAMYNLMADDYTFIDAHGNTVAGRDIMRGGWMGYFQWFPDYVIEIADVFELGNTVAAFGFASATFKGLQNEHNSNYWRLPAAWKAVTENGKIKLWQVYADTKIPFEIIAKNK